MAEATAYRDRMQSEVVQLMDQRGKLTAEARELEASANAARAEHDKLVKALEALKAKFKIGE